MPDSIAMSVCLYTCDNSRNDKQIVMKFQMRNFMKLIDSFQVLAIQSTETSHAS
jgi:hypothetical protein